MSYGRNLTLLQAEISKQKPRPDILKTLMRRTFPNRFDSFVNGGDQQVTLLEYLGDYPILKKCVYVSSNAPACTKHV